MLVLMCECNTSLGNKPTQLLIDVYPNPCNWLLSSFQYILFQNAPGLELKNVV
jgi:hypothetical protein